MYIHASSFLSPLGSVTPKVCITVLSYECREIFNSTTQLFSCNFHLSHFRTYAAKLQNEQIGSFNKFRNLIERLKNILLDDKQVCERVIVGGILKERLLNILQICCKRNKNMSANTNCICETIRDGFYRFCSAIFHFGSDKNLSHQTTKQTVRTNRLQCVVEAVWENRCSVRRKRSSLHLLKSCILVPPKFLIPKRTC